MRDDNIRRLLHYSTAKRRAAKLSPKKDDGKAARTALRHFAILRRGKNKGDDRFAELSLRNIGARILWVQDFCEIPTRLAELYKAGGSDWSKVY